MAIVAALIAAELTWDTVVTGLSQLSSIFSVLSCSYSASNKYLLFSNYGQF